MPGCGRGPNHPGWVIHSSIEVIGPPPAAGYRLIFPYIVGDLYGSANTGAFVAPLSLTPSAFTLDLNRTQDSLERELEPTDFEFRIMKITPRDAVSRGWRPSPCSATASSPWAGWTGWMRGRIGR